MKLTQQGSRLLLNAMASRPNGGTIQDAIALALQCEEDSMEYQFVLSTTQQK